MKKITLVQEVEPCSLCANISKYKSSAKGENAPERLDSGVAVDVQHVLEGLQAIRDFCNFFRLGKWLDHQEGANRYSIPM